MAKQDKPDPRVTKRRVTMTTVVATGGLDDQGRPVVAMHQAVDYVRPDFLDAYVADARTRWQTVEVSDEPDAGPAGYHGQTVIPERLNHPEAGRVFAATEED